MRPHFARLLGLDAWRVHDGGDPAGTPEPTGATTPAPTAPVAPAPTPPATPPTAAPVAATGANAAPAAPAPEPPTPPQPLDFEGWLKDPVNAGFVKGLREEAAGHRTKAKAEADRAQGILSAVMQAAGLQPDGKPDPEKVITDLRTQHETAQSELRQLRVDNALTAAVAKHGADPRLTRALLHSDGVLGAMDPAAADFAALLDAAVAKVVGEVPAVKLAAPTPPAPTTAASPSVSGGQFQGPGASNGTAQLTREHLKGMTPEEINTARHAGQLDALLGRI